MALIPCPGCGRIISESAPSCPQCGRATGATPAAPQGLAAPEPLAAVDPHPGAQTATAQLPPAVALPVPSAEHTFFPVSAGKFVAMSVLTFGIYDLYWSYRNWHRIKARSREDLSPFWRAFFAPLFAFALFERVHEAADRKKLGVGWSAGLLGVLYFLLHALWRLPDPWWTISLLGFAPVLPVVRTIEELHASEPSTEGVNSRYTGANIAAMIIGGLVLLLALLGAFFMPADGG